MISTQTLLLVVYICNLCVWAVMLYDPLKSYIHDFMYETEMSLAVENPTVSSVYMNTKTHAVIDYLDTRHDKHILSRARSTNRNIMRLMNVPCSAPWLVNLSGTSNSIKSVNLLSVNTSHGIMDFYNPSIVSLSGEKVLLRPSFRLYSTRETRVMSRVVEIEHVYGRYTFVDDDVVFCIQELYSAPDNIQ